MVLDWSKKRRLTKLEGKRTNLGQPLAPAADNLGRHPGHNGKRSHIARHHSARADHGPAPDAHVGRDHAVGPNPDIVFNNHLARLMALVHDGHILAREAVIGRADHRARPDGLSLIHI